MKMKEQEVHGVQVDLKQFFEASVRALLNDSQSAVNMAQGLQRSTAVVQRSLIEDAMRKRAEADAARALTALWKTTFKASHTAGKFTGRAG